VGTIYDPRELPGVSTAGPEIGRCVTSGIRADPRGFTGVCGLGVRLYGAWRIGVDNEPARLDSSEFELAR
jgi:hypothetical protein